MHKPTPKKTRKLFYNEYPYKIVTRVKYASYLRMWGILRIIDWCQTGIGPNPSYASKATLYSHWGKPSTPSPKEKAQLLEFCTILSSFSDKDCKFRVERSTLGIFLKDKTLYDTVSLALENFVTEQWEPENEEILSVLLTNKKIVICNEYPHNRYKYKVTLKPFKGTAGINLLEWAEQYPIEKLFLGNSSKKYLSTNDPISDPWMYVSDEKMVMMLNFASSGNVRRCEEFILRSSINSSS